MDRKNKAVIRRPLSVWGLGMALVLVACGSVTPAATRTASLRLEGGAVQVQAGDNGWVPVGGEATFELAGELESTDPWMVTGNTFATRDTTHIREGLEVGDLVRVKGILLEDGTWLANSIEAAAEQSDPAIVLIGKVDSIDPWVVHGITLEVTDNTEISGEITPGMLVEAEILLLENGTWEVLNIAPLSNFTEIPGCAMVTAVIVSVNGNEVQFAGWPGIKLDQDVKIEEEGGKEAVLNAHQTVLVIVCATEDGKFMITKIVVLKTNLEGDSANGEKVLVCHKPNKKGGHTLSIAAPAVPAHLAHGDKLGACP
jgi:hypothetical protein